MCSPLVRLLLVGAVFGTHAIKLSEPKLDGGNASGKGPEEYVGLTGPHGSDGLIIRYALLSPNNNPEWLINEGLPELQSSICLFEKQFVPAWMQTFNKSKRPIYMIYTDDNSQKMVSDLVKYSDYPVDAFLLRNLDEEHTIIPYHTTMKYGLKGLDDTDRASIRRQFADATLPANVSRLLVGTDIFPVHEPKEFMTALADQKKEPSAFYMADRKNAMGLYNLTEWKGPQCPGLKGDFIYLPPNVEVTKDSLEKKLDWYLSQPISPERQTPACKECAKKSLGYQAADEFVWSIAIGEVTPCHALTKKYIHQPRRVATATEVVHKRRPDVWRFGC